MVKSASRSGVSASFLSCLLSCPRKAFWKYQLGLKPKGYSPALEWGTGWHAFLEGWGQGEPVETALNRTWASVAKVPSDWQEDWIPQFSALAAGYATHYGPDGRGLYTGLVLDKTEVEFSFRCGGIDVEGRMDALGHLAQSGLLVLPEYKSASRVDSSYWKRVAIDRQPTMYLMGLDGVRHCLWDVVRKPLLRRADGESSAAFGCRLAADVRKRPGHYFERQLLVRTDDDFAEVQAEIASSWELWQWLSTSGRGPEFWPRNLGCCAQYGICEYYGLCSDLAGSSARVAGDFEQTFAEVEDGED
jgi:hypothetical protein